MSYQNASRRVWCDYKVIYQILPIVLKFARRLRSARAKSHVKFQCNINILIPTFDGSRHRKMLQIYVYIISKRSCLCKIWCLFAILWSLLFTGRCCSGGHLKIRTHKIIPNTISYLYIKTYDFIYSCKLNNVGACLKQTSGLWVQTMNNTAQYMEEALCVSINTPWSFMMTSSNGNIFRVTGAFCGELSVTGEFPSQRPMTRSFDVFFDLRLNKQFSKQSWGWLLETPSRVFLRHCNVSNKENTRMVTFKRPFKPFL